MRRWELCLAPGSDGLSAPAPGFPAEQGLPPVHLVDLDANPAERTNLQAAHMETVRRLSDLLERYRKTGRRR
jgi:hypothetical protein